MLKMAWIGNTTKGRLRIIGWAVASAAALGVHVSPALAAPEGCVATEPPGPVFENPCRYVAGDEGMYVANGDWELQIRRGDQTIRFSSAAGSPSSGDLGTIQAGDLVRGRALSDGSSVTFGNLSPLASNPAPPEPTEPPPYEVREGRAVVRDGTSIAWRLWLPKDARGPVPVVIGAPGWTSSSQQFAPESSPLYTQPLLRAGIAVLSYDPRGFGRSDGRSEVNGLETEGGDVVALVDLLAAQPGIRLDAPGDPRVGTVGGSYGGVIQLGAAALDHRIDAIAPDSTWNNLATSFMPHGIFRAGWMSFLGAAAAKSLYVDRPVSGDGRTGDVDPIIWQGVAEGLATGTWSAPVHDFFDSRCCSRQVLNAVKAPTLLMQGAGDTLFPPSEVLTTYRALKAARPQRPLRLVFWCGGHGPCTPNEWDQEQAEDVIDWMRRWLTHDPPAHERPPFTYPTQDGVTHSSKRFPVPARDVVGKSDGGVLVATGEPPTGGGGADPIFLLPAPYGAGTPLSRPPRPGVTTLKVPISIHDGIVVGEPRVRLSWTGAGGASDDTSHMPVFLRLIDRHTKTVIDNQETPRLLAVDGAHHTATLSMEWIAWDAGPDDDLALEITTSAMNFEPYRGAAAVRLDGIEVKLPVSDPRRRGLRHDRVDGDPRQRPARRAS